MGETVGNVKIGTHAVGSSGVVAADRYMTFHRGNRSINETLGGSTLGAVWSDLASAVAANDTSGFGVAIGDLRDLVSSALDGDWDSDWSQAVWDAFADCQS